MECSSFSKQAGALAVVKGETHLEVAIRITNAAPTSTGARVAFGCPANIETAMESWWVPPKNNRAFNLNLWVDVEVVKYLSIAVGDRFGEMNTFDGQSQLIQD